MRQLTDGVEGVLATWPCADLRSRSEVEQRGRDLSEREGVRIIRTPVRAPELQRLCGTIRALDQRGMPEPRDPTGRAPPPARLAEFVAHYHAERNHQGLENELIRAAARTRCPSGPVRRRQRMGGMLNYYYRAA